MYRRHNLIMLNMVVKEPKYSKASFPGNILF